MACGGAAAEPTTACERSGGNRLVVGPGEPYATPSAAAAVARSGDVVIIAAGDYVGDVATWTADHLTVCGSGGRARLFAAGAHAGGKAIWVIKGSNVTIEGIEFHDAKVPDRNGAGIRAEGDGLTIRRCGFFDNENGILSGNKGEITIDRSEFARNGFGDGQSHNLYVGRVERLVVTASYFHQAKIGHNFKSRAKETRVENSYFMDGPSGTSSYLLNVPDGGRVFLRGNLFHKGPHADNAIAISYGEEGQPWPFNTLNLVHNTFVMTFPRGTYIRAIGGVQSIKLTANLFAGVSKTADVINSTAIAKVVQAGNLTASAAHFDNADNIASPRFWPDSSLRKQSRLSSVADPEYEWDTPKPFETRRLAPASRYVGALQSEP
jgi:Right handed beta helix region